jgi:hypothetical protein
MKILVLQHIVSEHPGVFRDFLVNDGLCWDTIELDEGQDIPNLEPYDLMLVMGGPQDVWRRIATLGSAPRRKLFENSS